MTIVSLSVSLDVLTLTFQSCLFCFFFHPQQIIYTFTHQLSIFYPSVVSISFDMMIWLFRVDLAFLRCIPQFVIDVIPLYLHSGTYHITSQVHLAQSWATLNQSMKCPTRTNVVGPLTYAIIIFFIIFELSVHPDESCNHRVWFLVLTIIEDTTYITLFNTMTIPHWVEALHTDQQCT